LEALRQKPDKFRNLDRFQTTQTSVISGLPKDARGNGSVLRQEKVWKTRGKRKNVRYITTILTLMGYLTFVAAPT